MTDNGKPPRRRPLRLQNYDYSQAGAYFVTICTQNRECLFGDVVSGVMQLNDVGKIVADEWITSSEIRNEIILDEWVVMPNHFHGIVFISNSDERHNCRSSDISFCRGDRPVALTGPPPKSLGAMIAGFKSSATKRINESRQAPGAKLWQRNYWEHVIRNEQDFSQIREYIRNNPARWESDELFIS